MYEKTESIHWSLQMYKKSNYVKSGLLIMRGTSEMRKLTSKLRQAARYSA